jgi:hypothetical protein
MGGQTTFGYEQDDGRVLYAITFPAMMFDEIRGYIIDRSIPSNTPITEEALTINDYFSKERDEDEDTVWRVLYRLDGTTLCRVWSMPGDIVYTPMNLGTQ